jgi:hypothetical protein
MPSHALLFQLPFCPFPEDRSHVPRRPVPRPQKTGPTSPEDRSHVPRRPVPRPQKTGPTSPEDRSRIYRHPCPENSNQIQIFLYSFCSHFFSSGTTGSEERVIAKRPTRQCECLVRVGCKILATGLTTRNKNLISTVGPPV